MTSGEQENRGTVRGAGAGQGVRRSPGESDDAGGVGKGGSGVGSDDRGGGGSGGKRTFQAPKGTRDFYPADMLRRRYIVDAWRRVSLRHGFEEIDGPTFENAELYAVKSGEGILGEMFGVYSGKDPEDLKQIAAAARGEPGAGPPFALRPEFTPTLARMYAARARQLPQPTKWFCVSNFFRAERPQRGRLREFWQWNADVIGGENRVAVDAEIMTCLVNLLDAVGISSTSAEVCINDRSMVEQRMSAAGVPAEKHAALLGVLDQLERLDEAAIERRLADLGIERSTLDRVLPRTRVFNNRNDAPALIMADADVDELLDSLAKFASELIQSGWICFNPSIVRGLAYYTGLVFEVIAEGERAVAGGGRYDKLIELFGGPPTPACGFGMGDAVLGNLLEDRGLIPTGADMLRALSQPMPYRPDAFVVAANDEAEEHVIPLVAALRRGKESEAYLSRPAPGKGDPNPAARKPWHADRYDLASGGVPPLHARRTYKTTRNVGKLLAEASACSARYAVVIENKDGECTIKNLDENRQWEGRIPRDDVPRRIALGR